MRSGAVAVLVMVVVFAIMDGGSGADVNINSGNTNRNANMNTYTPMSDHEAEIDLRAQHAEFVAKYRTSSPAKTMRSGGRRVVSAAVPIHEPLDESVPYNDTLRYPLFCARMQRFAAYNREFVQRLERHELPPAVLELLGGGADMPRVVVNELMDLTDEELARVRPTGFADRSPRPARTSTSPALELSSDVPVKDATDWRTIIRMNEVTDQGSCGACWAFAATAVMEMAHTIATGETVKLSEQQLIDCAEQLGGDLDGCSGGTPKDAFAIVHAAGGQCLRQDYPFHASKGRCDGPSFPFRAHVSGYADKSISTVEALGQLVDQQPVTITLRVNDFFQTFPRVAPVILKSDCPDDPTKKTHAVAVVGQQNQGRMLLIRNSWGKGWGLAGGYAFLEAGACGMFNLPVNYPILAGRCGLSPCPANRMCVNRPDLPEGYSCECPVAAENGCAANSSRSVPPDASADCPCVPGFSCGTDHHVPVDTDECAANNGGCYLAKTPEACHNLPGTFHCGCIDGMLDVSDPNCVTPPDSSFVDVLARCKACPQGAYCKNGRKLACRMGRWSDYNTQDLDQCKLYCPAGHVCFNFTKTTCQPGTFAEAGLERAECKVCPAGKFSDEGAGSCYDCPSGSTCDYGKKVACPDGKWSSPGSSKAGDCRLVCDAGYVCSNGQKSPCPAGTYAPQGLTAAHCTNCAAGTWSDPQAKSQADCGVCPAGFVCANGVKTECPIYYFAPAGLNSGNCLICPVGTYNDAIGAPFCMECPAGSACYNGRKLGCPRGTFGPQPGAWNCPECPIGFFCDSFGMTAPTPCPPGTSTDAPAATQCTACDDTHYCTGGAPAQDCFTSTPTVCGDLLVKGSYVSYLPCNSLKSIAIAEKEEVQELVLPCLQRVEQMLYLQQNPGLRRVALKSLTYVNVLMLSGQAFLEELELPALQIIGQGMDFSRNQLSHLNFPSLEYAEDLYVRDNPELVEFAVPKFHKFRNLAVERNPKLALLDLTRVPDDAAGLKIDMTPFPTVISCCNRMLRDEFKATCPDPKPANVCKA